MKSNKPYVIWGLLFASSICIIIYFWLSNPDDIERMIKNNQDSKYGIAVVSIMTGVRYFLLITGITIPLYLAYRHFLKKDL